LVDAGNSKPEGGWPFRLTLKEFIGLFGDSHHAL
jgi:hypothetical protein